MSLAAIEQLLKQKMGLHSATVGSGTIGQAVERRMRECGITDIDDYRNIINHSDTELNALIDTVVIPETWFFRDQHPFAAFREWLQNEWLAGEPAAPLRILSVPCSTGEEPYTLAMCLADCGIAPDQARIDAIDISSSNIEKARSARYGNNSFRGADLGFRDRHFEAVEGGFQLREDIRRRVRFEQLNLLDASFSQGRAPYQIIFCRNLLIYFDRPTQHLAIDRLQQLLVPDGILFLGHSETSLLLERRFVALEYPRCFGFRYREATPVDHGRHRDTPATRRDTRRRQRPVQQHQALPFAPPAPEPPAKGERNPQPEPAAKDSGELLQQAFQLANQGHLDEAAACCTRLLRQKERRAETYYLLGLIREAAGNPGDAEQMFRNAVYLDPGHDEALEHLGILFQQRGDHDNAQRFRTRAERVRKRRQGVEA